MRPTLECDIRFVEASGQSRISIVGATVSSLDEGKRVSIDVNGTVEHRVLDNFVNSTEFDLDTPLSDEVEDAACVISTDNTSAMQDAIDNNVEVDISNYGWFGTRNLNFTGHEKARVLIGNGVPFSGPWIHPLEEGGTLLDFGGRSSIHVEGFTFGEDMNGLRNPNIPAVGFFPSAPRSVSGGSVDHIIVRNVCGTGRFSKAATPLRGGSYRFDCVAMWNYYSGAYAWAFDSDNALGVVTAAGSLTGVYEISPSVFTMCEGHGMNGAFSALFRGARSLTWLGGTLSGAVSQTGHVRIMGNSNGDNGMRLCSFLGVRFEAEGGNAANIFRVDSCNAWDEGLENFFGLELGNGDKRSSNLFGCSGDIVTGDNPTAVANFLSCAVGLPRD